DGGQDATRAHPIVWKAKEKFPRDGRPTLKENEDDRTDNGQNGHHCHEGDECIADALHRMTIAGEEFHHDKILSARLLARKTTDEARTLTVNEMRKRMMPMRNKV